MLIKEFLSRFEEVIPANYQDDWDNSGLQVGDTNVEIKGIFVCLDVTNEVIEEARLLGANLILSHHPILFRSTKKLDYDFFISKKIIDAIKNDIVIYSSHTAIDVNEKGLNQFVFKEMGFRSKGKIEVTEVPHGYGDFTDIPPAKIEHLAEQIKERLELDHIVFYGDDQRLVSKIGLVTGAGSSFLERVVQLGIELYITADVKHHEAMDALEQGINVMDLGHYPSEKLFNVLVEKIIKDIDSSITIYRETELDRYKRYII